MRERQIPRLLSLAAIGALLAGSTLFAGPPAAADESGPKIEPVEVTLTDSSGEPTADALSGFASADAAELADGSTIEESAIITDQLSTGEFTVSALTWAAEDDFADQNTAYVRVLESSGWSEWASIDTDSAEAAESGGSAPFISAVATAIQIQVIGATETLPADLTLVIAEFAGASWGRIAPQPTDQATVEAGPMTRSGDSTEGQEGIARGIHPRSDWDGGSPATDWDQETAELKAAVVHHTAGTNNYAERDVPGIIAGIYYYHAVTLGWGDIGYNFLVDKFGGMWEGREGSLDVKADSMIVGGHAYGNNVGTMGVSVLGTFTDVKPSQAIMDGFQTIIQYRFSLAGLDARDKSGFRDLNGSALPRVFGHRDVYATECPGMQIYSQLSSLIQRIGAPGFADVGPSNQFIDEITWLANRGVTTGWTMANGSREFRPLEPVARDAMAAFMYRLAGSPQYTAPKTPLFTDVPTTSKFYKEISWLAEEGISTGWELDDGQKEFRPREPVARDAMAAFLYRYADEVMGKNVAGFAPPTISPFTDIQPGDKFYREVSWLAEEGISTGWQIGGGLAEFRPLNSVARDAMAAFMYRLVNKR